MDLERTQEVVDQINKIEKPEEAIIAFLIGRMNAIGAELESAYNRIRGPGKELPKLDVKEEEGLEERVREHESLLSALAKIVQKTKVKDTGLGQRYLNLYSDFLVFKAVFVRTTELYKRSAEQAVRGGEEDNQLAEEPNPKQQETTEPQTEQCQVPDAQNESICEEEPAVEVEQKKRRSTRLKNKK